MKRLFLLCLMLTVAACATPPPPPPPPPPPAPTPPPVFLVFFDWDSAVVGPSGREVIGLAAQTYKAGSPVTVQVTGFTDTSGSADYNQRLSVRRANAAAAVLVQDGVPQNALVVTGRGQNDLRVPTSASRKTVAWRSSKAAHRALCRCDSPVG
jgi:OmpA-OmpF porin, OOP family